MSKLISSVTVNLDGTDIQLVPSLDAATQISNRFDGFVAATQALGRGDLVAYQFVVRAGSTKETRKRISSADMNELVYRAGVNSLVQPLVRFVHTCQNGGRDPEAEEDDDQDSHGEDGDEGNVHV